MHTKKQKVGLSMWIHSKYLLRLSHVLDNSLPAAAGGSQFRDTNEDEEEVTGEGEEAEEKANCCFCLACPHNRDRPELKARRRGTRLKFCLDCLEY